ncbi:hypothetical protein M0R72_07125 [Candidatus Pacearchaeota archaeon]|jgi:hypothetical protein|nr:hypothetical protein [Candidatus Pacearchaeota archaeon]
MNMIAEVARLKELEGRLAAIKARQRDTGKPNHALLERLDIERCLANALPAILDVLGGFQPGDGDLLEEMISWMEAMDADARKDGIIDGFLQEEIDVLRRMQAMAVRMEESK